MEGPEEEKVPPAVRGKVKQRKRGEKEDEMISREIGSFERAASGVSSGRALNSAFETRLKVLPGVLQGGPTIAPVAALSGCPHCMDEGRFCVLSAYDMNGLPSSMDAGAGATTATPTAAGGGRRDEIVEAGSGSARSRSVCARACASFSRLGRWPWCTPALVVFLRYGGV
ncbi:hypothetical protein HPB48_000693 [Haemaphysalis longicornis]|uniref:Uncharacterized protein n=1 Tax=Haemaphysalis longicornis TaxID=44386 RepID=A0A9J6H3K6_HAELO|nr:hypothetical protein HPB48_000693 [Haemaphysalis longicornis]